jgi:hypothetical protein
MDIHAEAEAEAAGEEVSERERDFNSFLDVYR